MCVDTGSSPLAGFAAGVFALALAAQWPVSGQQPSSSALSPESSSPSIDTAKLDDFHRCLMADAVKALKETESPSSEVHTVLLQVRQGVHEVLEFMALLGFQGLTCSSLETLESRSLSSALRLLNTWENWAFWRL